MRTSLPLSRPDTKETLCKQELSLTEDSLRKNPKAYVNSGRLFGTDGLFRVQLRSMASEKMDCGERCC